MEITVVGPFVGELLYEACYFAPHVIYTKVNNPKMKIAVYTDKEHVDLYGSYIDMFIKSNIDRKKGSEWGAKIYSKDQIRKVERAIFRKLSMRYRVIDFISPDIFGYRSKWLWQFPRYKMCYDFKPFKNNFKLLKKITNEEGFVLSEDNNFNLQDRSILTINTIKDGYDKSRGTTLLGVVIEAIRHCSIHIGRFDSLYTRLAMLMGKPVILLKYEKGDIIHLANPKRVPVIIADSADRGIEIYYENYL